jgi:hypothetical protein
MNLTQWLGILGFGVAGLLSLGIRQPFWTAIGSVHLLYSADCVLGWRHELSGLGAAALGEYYSDRAPLQIILVIGALLIGAALLTWARCTVCEGSARIALTATTISGGLFVAEVISLHDMDAILYQTVGPTLLIGWLWLGLALITGLAATYSRLRMRPCLWN